MDALPFLLSVHATACTAVDAASQAYTAAERSFYEHAAAHQADPPRALHDAKALAGQALIIATWERDLLAYRIARYRIAKRWHGTTTADRAARHPGPQPWTLERFASERGIDFSSASH